MTSGRRREAALQFEHASFNGGEPFHRGCIGGLQARNAREHAASVTVERSQQIGFNAADKIDQPAFERGKLFVKLTTSHRRGRIGFHG
jgi:hypothetical protein